MSDDPRVDIVAKVLEDNEDPTTRPPDEPEVYYPWLAQKILEALSEVE